MAFSDMIEKTSSYFWKSRNLRYFIGFLAVAASMIIWASNVKWEITDGPLALINFDIDWIFTSGRILFSISLLIFYVRIFRFYAISKYLGPKVLMVGRMVFSILLKFKK